MNKLHRSISDEQPVLQPLTQQANHFPYLEK